ncbi:MAG: hypothetical protein IJF40_07150 [Clostridia bacterium]|nr:hypothetical protein [Clostridia bacterium]
MLEAFKEYWYFTVLLIALIVLTCWVISKAWKASVKANRIREEQMKRMEYENGVLKEFKDFDDAKLSAADPKRAFDGIALNIQKNLENQKDMEAAFDGLTEPQKRIYALYYLAEDSQKGLSEFFKCNGAPLTPVALEGVRELFPSLAVAAFEEEYGAYDPDDEETSLVNSRIEQLDKDYSKAVESFDIYKTFVDYIRKNITDFS